MSVGAYASSPVLAFPGWRLRVRAGASETSDGQAQYHGHLGDAGDPVQGFGIYRAPGELPPRPNAGNVVGPHGMAGMGAAIISRVEPVPGWGRTLTKTTACPEFQISSCPSGQMIQRGGPPCYSETCVPSTGGSTGSTSWVPQPPPWQSWGAAPTVASLCPNGETQDAAGNCVADLRNPYPLYLPAQPSPVVAANTSCPVGYSQDANGNCTVPANTTSACPAGDTVDVNGNCVAPAASTGITDWLSGSTLISGLPNWVLAAVGAVVAFKMLGGKR